MDTLAAMTSPEIRDFFARYVWDSQRLPIAEYYGKLGIRLIEGPDSMPERFEVDSAPTPDATGAPGRLAGPQAPACELTGGPQKSGV